MADNVPVTPGSGASIRTDEVAGVHYQVVKLAGGADGVANLINGTATYGLDVSVTQMPASVVSLLTQMVSLLTDISASNTFDVVVSNESLTSQINGIKTTFDTLYAIKPGTSKLYRNGIRQREGAGYDYLENTSSVTLAMTPATDETLIIDYTKA